MKEIQIKNLNELQEFASAYLGELKSKKRTVVVGLSGDLGSGKTTFSQTIAKGLGINEIVTSPTFIIQKTYKTTDNDFLNFVHIDAYRLDSPEELLTLGFQKLLEQENTLIFIEWPEKVSKILPEDTEYLYFTFINEQERLIKY